MATAGIVLASVAPPSISSPCSPGRMVLTTIADPEPERAQPQVPVQPSKSSTSTSFWGHEQAEEKRASARTSGRRDTLVTAWERAGEASSGRREAAPGGSGRASCRAPPLPTRGGGG